MSVFFDYNVDLAGGVGPVLHSAWSKGEAQPLLAVAGSDRRVILVQEEGEPLPHASLCRPVSNALPTHVAWHPQARFLVAGWSDGALNFWSDSKNEQELLAKDEKETVHRAQISLIRFSPTGARCVTVDQTGVVAVWGSDGRNRMQPLCQHRQFAHEEGYARIFDRLVFRTNNINRKETNFENPQFFFGGDTGVVYLGDDQGWASERYRVGSTILLLEYMHGSDRVAVLTAAQLLVVFGLDKDLCVVRETKSKLSCGPHPERLSGCWAGSGLLATVSEESLVRLWDLEREENYVLALHGKDPSVRSGGKACAVDFNSAKRVLGVATKDGRIVQWRSAFLDRSPASEADWQPLPGVQVNAGLSGDIEMIKPTKLEWGPGEHLLAVTLGNGLAVSILAETHLARCCVPPLMAVQVGPSQLLVQRIPASPALPAAVAGRGAGGSGGAAVSREGGGPFPVFTDEHSADDLTAELPPPAIAELPFRLRGLACAPPLLAAWSKWQVQIFECSGPAFATLNVATSFQHPQGVRAVALLATKEERQIFLATQKRVEVLSLQGAVRKSLPFSDFEGSPVLLDACGGFLACATDRQYIKVWNVSKVEPKQVNPPRRFEQSDKPLGSICSIRCNCRGSRVSIIADHRPSLLAAAAAAKGGGGGGGEAERNGEGEMLNGTGTTTSPGSPSSSSSVSSPDELKAPHARLFVYDTDLDSFLSYMVGEKSCPVEHFWEPSDPRFVSCEVVPQLLSYVGEGTGEGGGGRKGGGAKGWRGEGAEEEEEDAAARHLEALASPSQRRNNRLLSLFVAPDGRLLKQEIMPCWQEGSSELLMSLGVSVPYGYFLSFAAAGGDSDAPRGRRASVGSVGSRGSVGAPDGGGPSESKAPAEAPKPLHLRASIQRRTMRDFAGLVTVDAQTAAALLDFSFHLACGATDEAYKSVQQLRSRVVWESMARCCVKTRRLDVATKCLSQMGRAAAAAAVRKCTDKEPEAKLAQVAVHLGMLGEAAQLYRECGRADLYAALLSDACDWDGALAVAKSSDRINLKSIHHAHGQHLERIGDIAGAMRAFKEAGTWRTETPRLLRVQAARAGPDTSAAREAELAEFVEGSGDKEVRRWYAQLLESRRDLEGAARNYRLAEDWQALVRLSCISNDLHTAEQVAIESDDKAAAFELAKALEQAGRLREAVQYFGKAQRLRHALRLARSQGMENDLVGLALNSPPREMVRAAEFYEREVKQPNKAALLYHRSGQLHKAIEVCFRNDLFEPLKKVCEDLKPDTDPQVLARCAEFFRARGQQQKAVQLLAMAKRYDEALVLLEAATEQGLGGGMGSDEDLGQVADGSRRVQFDIQLEDETVERLTPEKGEMDAERRASLLMRLARVCKGQGLFALACKKYTQAGDKVRAMKALLKTGDTEKIVFFAGTARQPDIYVLAANFLQGLCWQSDPDLMKNIIAFYLKGRAFDKLALFYEDCAQVEVDEYRDYDKAVTALREAVKCVCKGMGVQLGPDQSLPAGLEHDERVASLRRKIETVERFVQAKRLQHSDPNEMVKVCMGLIEDPTAEQAIRLGDVFAELVGHCVSRKAFSEAYALLQKMTQRGIALSPHIDRPVLDMIASEMDVDIGDLLAGEGDQVPSGQRSARSRGGQPIEEDIEEEF